MRRPLVLAAAIAALSGCGDDPPDREPSRPRVLTGTVDLDRPPAPADAGTSGGHRAPDGVASTSRTSLGVRGTVKPAASAVTIRAGDTGPPRAGRVSAGRFTVVAAGLRRGSNRFVIEARAKGYRPWTAEVTITRR